MKKMVCMLSMLPVLAAGLFADEQEKPFPDNPTFHQVRSAFIPADVLENVESARMTYAFSSDKIPSSFLMIRAKRYDKVRVDYLIDGALYSSVRNGESFWTYSQRDGIHTMDSADAVDFAQFISFLPIPFYKESSFDNPVYKAEQTISGAVRSVFTVKTRDGSDVQYELVVDNKTKLLRKVDQVMPSDADWGITFQNYKTVNGIKIPGVINMVTSTRTLSLTLINADWNLSVDDAIFKKNGNIVDSNLAILMDVSKTKNPQINQNRKNSPQEKIEKLERKISKTKLEIKDAEDQLARMENLYMSNKEQSVDLAHVTDNGGYRYWYGGWSSGGGNNRDSRTRRSVVKAMGKQNEQIATEYKKLSTDLHRLRMNLNDYEYELQKLQESQAIAEAKAKAEETK